MEDDTDGGGSSHSASLTTVDLSPDQAAVADPTGHDNQLPCCIKQEGPTSASRDDVDGQKAEEAYSIGRELHGTTPAPPPEGYSGFTFTVRSPDKETCTTNTDPWPPKMTFHNVTVGNDNAMPSSNDDAFLRAFRWFSTANSKTFQNVQQSRKNAHTGARNDKWAIKEDIALMTSWCFASESSPRGKNQRKISFWSRVQELYDAYQVDHSEEISPRNDNQMKGRWKRLNENANKWIAAYREAYRKMGGIGMSDIEKEAHAIYEASGTKFYDHIVFNEVMCKHPKWELQIDRETTHFRSEVELGNDESGSSTKRPKTSKERDYSIPNTPEMPNNGGLTIPYPICKDAVTKEKCMPDSGGSTIPYPTSEDGVAKEKCKVLQSSSTHNEFVAELNALGINRDKEVEIMNKRLDLELKREERKAKKMYHMHLNTLLAKEHLSKEDKDMKRHLWAMLFGK